MTEELTVLVDADVLEELRQIAEAASEDYPSDIDAATEQAVTAVGRRPALREALVYCGMRGLVHDARHRVNVRIKRENGGYGGPAKVNGFGPAVQEAYRSVYDIRVDGNVLGDLLGNQLAGLATTEREVSKGHALKADLLDWLVTLKIPDKKKVRDSVSEKKLRTTYRRLYREHYGREILA